jgi:type IV secretory pathway TraG/TraD family ATPase VirD4
MYAGRYLYPNKRLGAQIRVGNTQPKIIVGGNSAGKGAGIIIPNLLMRLGVSQFTIDTRMQAAAVSALWRRTVDEKQTIGNSYGSLTHLPEFADLKSPTGINLLEAPELDPNHPLCTDHLTVMARTVFPADNDHQPYFPTATQGLFIAFAYGELVEAKQQNRKPLLADVRRKVLERSEYNTKTGEPEKGMAFYARQLIALNNPFVNSCIDRFSGQTNDEMLSVIGTFEANSRWMMSPMLSEDEKRGGTDFGEMGRRVCSAYLGVPMEHIDSCAPFLRLAISSALRPLFAPHDIPVTFWIDEFYALKRIPAVENAIGVVAGSKIEIIIVVQSLAMLAHTYSKVWEALVGQAGAIILVGPAPDKFTADYLSARSGTTNFVQPNAGWSMNPGGTGMSGGDGYKSRPYLMPQDLYSIPAGQGYVWLSGLANPVPAAFPGYYTDPVLSRRARRDPYVRW